MVPDDLADQPTCKSAGRKADTSCCYINRPFHLLPTANFGRLHSRRLSGTLFHVPGSVGLANK